MKATLLVEREVMEFHPGTKKPLAPPALVAQCVRRGKFLYAPAGTLIDDPQCWLIVLMGQAEPADDECRATTEQSVTEREAALHAAKRLALGIRPEHFAMYDAGEILGYHGNGAMIPGPNAKKPTPNEDDEE
jgi:hypothetical protein